MKKNNNSDVDSLFEENNKLKKENQLLKQIIDNSHQMVFAVNESDRLILYNREAERVEGIKKKDALGKIERDVYPNYRWADDVTVKIRKTKKPILEEFYEYDLPSGRKANMIYSSYPFFHEGKIDSVYTIGQSLDQISHFLKMTLEKHKQLKNGKEEDTCRKSNYYLEDIIGTSKQISEAVSFARKIASHNSSVLIVGETGTGKELFAHGIHNASLFSEGPFVPINCAAIPESLLESILFGTVKGAFTGAMDLPGLFEQAENGTIFLDEINSMHKDLQAKLLRVIQDKKVRRLGSKVQIPTNCRIISASGMDQNAIINEGVMRTDLFFRLATIIVNIPPLRAREGDCKVLSMRFINKFNKSFGSAICKISDELLSLFDNYSWPGNVRELENLIECGMHFVAPTEEILQLNHFPDYIKEKLLGGKEKEMEDLKTYDSLHSILLEVEKRVVRECLERNKGNVTRAARDLGISRQSLHYKIKNLLN
ncbi:MAG: sigma-54 interaction domain-containing protein [Dehalobacterium sp.]|jgi:arginine utilization regulatory protein